MTLPILFRDKDGIERLTASINRWCESPGCDNDHGGMYSQRGCFGEVTSLHVGVI